MKKIIYFGVGENLKNLPQIKCDYFVDNNAKIQGSMFEGKEVMSPDVLLTEDKENIEIIIISSAYNDISMQLTEMGFKDQVHFFDAFQYFELKKVREIKGMHFDVEDEFLEIYKKCKNYTMTTWERMYSLYQAVKYVVNRNIEGDFVECGVWRGGSSMVIAMTLLKLGVDNRKIILYDTFKGMSEPTEDDIDMYNNEAMPVWSNQATSDYNKWCYASLEDVHYNMSLTQYNMNNVSFVEGMVEDTIPRTNPNKIAILRLDTDWYESTYHEMNHLFPIVSNLGVLIIDDYGHWQGARKAINQYFEENKYFYMLQKIDETGRVMIKA